VGYPQRSGSCRGGMKRRSLEFEPGYTDPGRMSLELGRCASSQNDAKGSCPSWREGCKGTMCGGETYT
jgi:hypothetical protein